MSRKKQFRYLVYFLTADGPQPYAAQWTRALDFSQAEQVAHLRRAAAAYIPEAAQAEFIAFALMAG